VSVGLFASEIYAHWVRKKELDKWVYLLQLTVCAMETR